MPPGEAKKASESKSFALGTPLLHVEGRSSIPERMES